MQDKLVQTGPDTECRTVKIPIGLYMDGVGACKDLNRSTVALRGEERKHSFCPE